MRTRRDAVALAVTAFATAWTNVRVGAQTPSVATTLCPTGKLRAAVIAEWRGLPEPKARPDHWEAPAELLPRLMQRLGLKERLHEAEVIDAWAKIVGDFIAAHSAPVALREGVLYVRVLQPSLHYELEQISKNDILRKLKRRFGAKIIRNIRFRLG